MRPLLLLLLSVFSLHVYAQDVEFFTGTWEEAKAKAQQEGKMIFVDAFTYWCGPCKMMDKEMFHNNAEVAALMQKHFISYKVECEHGAGIDFARKYKVNVYPTMLFFNTKGELLEKHLGYNSDQKEFIAGIQKMVDMDQTDVYDMNHTQMVMPWPDFYVKNFKDANDSTWKRDRTVDANLWLDQQTDLFSESVWAVMYMYDLNEKYSNYFLEHLDTYISKYKFEAKDKINSIAYSFMARARKENKPELLTKAEDLLRKYSLNPEAEVYYLRYNYYASSENFTQLAQITDDYIKSGAEVSLGLINDVSWTLYEKTDDQKLIQMAIDWFAPYLKDINDYNAMDTYAALLYKSKDYKNAETWAVKAIEQGKADELDVQATEELLENIRAAK